MTCPVCNERDRDVVLPCNHMFCSECMGKNIESRKRKCPMCRLPIDKKDLKKIPWGYSDLVNRD